MHKFRFQDLEIWHEGIRLGGVLCKFADEFEQQKHFRFAEQIRGAALSISNNIAEGSGSTSSKEFQQFLNYARRSVFENANMILFFVMHDYISESAVGNLLEDLDHLSAKILKFSRTLGG
jgi:four helix bundle protein